MTISMLGGMASPVRPQTPPRFRVTDDSMKKAEDAFRKMTPNQKFVLALQSMAKVKEVPEVRKGVLEACIDAWTLEGTFNVVPHFINSLAGKSLQGCTIVKEFAEQAGKDLDMDTLMQATGDIILERANNEPDPQLKAKAQDMAKTVRLIRSLNKK